MNNRNSVGMIIASLAIVAVGLTLTVYFVRGGTLQSISERFSLYVENQTKAFLVLTPASRKDAEIRNEISAFGCALRMQQGNMPINNMDECISGGSTVTAEVYQYVVGESLGAKWDDLSITEKQIALAKVKAGAEVAKEYIAAAKLLGAPVGGWPKH